LVEAIRAYIEVNVKIPDGDSNRRDPSAWTSEGEKLGGRGFRAYSVEPPRARSKGKNQNVGGWPAAGFSKKKDGIEICRDRTFEGRDRYIKE